MNGVTHQKRSTLLFIWIRLNNTPYIYLYIKDVCRHPFFFFTQPGTGWIIVASNVKTRGLATRYGLDYYSNNHPIQRQKINQNRTRTGFRRHHRKCFLLKSNPYRIPKSHYRFNLNNNKSKTRDTTTRYGLDYSSIKRQNQGPCNPVRVGLL